MPTSVAIRRARSACHGSVTTTAVRHPRSAISRRAARRLLSVSRPSPTGRTSATPRCRRYAAPAPASVNRSPGARPPTVTTRGATPSRYSSRACSRRASNTELGRPSNWLAPSTRITSLRGRSSLRATAHTRTAVPPRSARTRRTAPVTSRRVARSAGTYAVESADVPAASATAARPASSRATGTRNGEQDT